MNYHALLTIGSKMWERRTALGIILVLGLGIYFVVTGLLSGSEIWWYDLALPLLAFSGLGLILLVRTGKKTYTYIRKYGFNPSSGEITEEAYHPEETGEEKADSLDDASGF